MIWIYYILGFGTGYLVGGIVSGVEQKKKEAKELRAMQEAQMREIGGKK